MRSSIEYLPVTALTVSAVIIGLERLRPARREAGQPGLNIAYWAVRRPQQLWLVPAFAGAALAATRPLDLPSLHTGDWGLLWACVAFFLTMDLAEYLFHRAQHAVPLLWRMHSLHHSDPCMSVLTTERHFWGELYLRAVLIWSPVFIVLDPPGAAVGLYSVCQTWNLLLHANLRLNFGPLSWLVNTPDCHRIHHSAEPEHRGVNFATLFPIWDVLGRTYLHPTTIPPTGTGDHRPLTLIDALLWPLVGAGGRGRGQLDSARIGAP